MANAGYFVYVAMASATGSFLFGLDIGYIGGIMVDPYFKQMAGIKDSFNPATEISDAWVGFVTSSFSVGAMIGAFPLLSAWCLDNRGRKGTMFIGSVLFLFGAGIQAVGTNLYYMAIGRLIAGMSIGLLSTAIPLYQSEIAPTEMRGKLTAVYQLNITLGIFAANALNVTLLRVPWYGWRLVIAVQLIPAIALLLALPTLPYSPRWLIQQGRKEEAKDVLHRLYEPDRANEQYTTLVEADIRDKAIGQPAWSDLVSKPRIRGLMAVGITIQLLQQLCGMNVFMYFGPSIFTAAGWNGTVVSMFLSLTNVFSTFIGIFTVDTLGRRLLMMGGGLGMSLASLIAGTSSTFRIPAVFFFVVAFASTWGPVAWIYCAEIFPMKYRSRLIGVSTMANWTGNFSIGAFAKGLFSVLSFGFLYVLMMFDLACAGFGFWAPETKGVSLEDVAALWDGKLAKDVEAKSN